MERGRGKMTMTKRILCACIAALMALAAAAQGQEEELAWALRDHALAQGECLAQVLEYAQDLHMPMEGGEEILAYFQSLDLRHPQRILLYVPPEGMAFDPSQYFETDMEGLSAEAVISYAVQLPIMAARYGDSGYLNITMRTQVNGALVFEELEGIAYALQIFGQGEPVIVSAFATTQYPAAICHTAILYHPTNMVDMVGQLCLQMERVGNPDLSPEKQFAKILVDCQTGEMEEISSWLT